MDYHSATGMGKNLSISKKHAREVLAFIKGMKVNQAINRLEQVINHKEAVPFKRFNTKIGHRKGMSSGRYPEKTCKAVITVLNNAKNNALNKGLQEGKLIIKQGITMMDVSKRRRVRARKGGYTGSMKLTSIKIQLEEEE